jgi:hypothetical protein
MRFHRCVPLFAVLTLLSLTACVQTPTQSLPPPIPSRFGSPPRSHPRHGVAQSVYGNRAEGAWQSAPTRGLRLGAVFDVRRK